MTHLGQPVLNPVRLADHVEAHRPGDGRVSVPRLLCELEAVIGAGNIRRLSADDHFLQRLVPLAKPWTAAVLRASGAFEGASKEVSSDPFTAFDHVKEHRSGRPSRIDQTLPALSRLKPSEMAHQIR